MKQFAPGDVVRLKSGSPAMAVEFVSGRTASCVWFVDRKLYRDTFDVDALTIDEKGTKQ